MDPTDSFPSTSSRGTDVDRIDSVSRDPITLIRDNDRPLTCDLMTHNHVDDVIVATEVDGEVVTRVHRMRCWQCGARWVETISERNP